MRTPKRLKYDFTRNFHYQIANVIMPDKNCKVFNIIPTEVSEAILNTNKIIV